MSTESSHHGATEARFFSDHLMTELGQALIDRGQYGCVPGIDLPKHLLGAAEYNLVSRPPERTGAGSVTTFCMCPGGEIIAATSDAGQLSTNGMSRYARSSPYANAGLIVNQPVPRPANGRPNRRFVQVRGIDDPLLTSRVHGLELHAGGSWFSEAGVQQTASAGAAGDAGQTAIQAVPGVEVVGIDVSKYGIEHAKEEVKQCLQVASAAELPFADQSFDLVIRQQEKTFGII